ncbi:M23 family metallopeptidase [Aquibacillus sp. 3ASR75-54]|uniref:M23 family metallopeptidase n=2 Tax=Aquibacillus salsiterrae TaxID=2950439 RepID=A0A9X3WC69_9BACI|nr:M23 family metallopeptidase [Aquibacillus salsiterrae]
MADGIVISTNTPWDGQMNGYGNVILIAHSVNGTVYTTLYAHLDSMSVTAGQSVSKGQTIGKMGSTGNVTGPHLHFEVHKGGWNAAKSNAVNPMNMLP